MAAKPTKPTNNKRSITEKGHRKMQTEQPKGFSLTHFFSESYMFQEHKNMYCVWRERVQKAALYEVLYKRSQRLAIENPNSGIFTYTSDQAHNNCGRPQKQPKTVEVSKSASRYKYANLTPKKPSRPKLNSSDYLESMEKFTTGCRSRPGNIGGINVEAKGRLNDVWGQASAYLEDSDIFFDHECDRAWLDHKFEQDETSVEVLDGPGGDGEVHFNEVDNVYVWFKENGEVVTLDEETAKMIERTVTGMGSVGGLSDWSKLDGDFDIKSMTSVSTNDNDNDDFGVESIPDEDWVDVDDTVKNGGFSYADMIKKKTTGTAPNAPVAVPPVPFKYSNVSARKKKEKEKKVTFDDSFKENESYADYDGSKAMMSGKKLWKGEGRTCRSNPYRYRKYG
ncbi:hypothetical protein TL16_g11601 [Triparma laevis f. inornata]|uniref:Uncharacterized protein n=2 Tax=Triparma laevis TaxID=1534972 RepID=A0A9W7ED83_9STRA|nr:hypothetical protein TrLO_g15845 [Triparma laevis f. longispina]GMH89902.1 hypothetical protein TL16_g11601 [Triparma laevis f. inornata]